MINSRSKQRGLSILAICFLLGIGSFLALFAFKVGPAYFEFWTVSKIAEDVQANADLLKKPRSKILRSIDQSYRTNNLWDLRAEETITLTKHKSKGYTVKVDYEKRANLLSNIDVVTVFSKDVSNPTP